MHVPTAAELIGAWERGAAQHWVGRGLTLLSAAYPEKNIGQLEALTVAERDRALLELRARLFGAALTCYAECPQCQTRLEFTVDVRELLPVGAAAKVRAHDLVWQDLRLRFCALDSEDLAALIGCERIAAARRTLLERCLLEASRGDQPVSLDDIPPEAVNEISVTLAQAESEADISLALECVSCAHRWNLVFDIVSFLWAEISAVAKRSLNEVHTLAWAYGWREADILAMSPARRQFYLDRVANG